MPQQRRQSLRRCVLKPLALDTAFITCYASDNCLLLPLLDRLSKIYQSRYTRRELPSGRLWRLSLRIRAEIIDLAAIATEDMAKQKLTRLMGFCLKGRKDRIGDGGSVDELGEKDRRVARERRWKCSAAERRICGRDSARGVTTEVRVRHSSSRREK